MRTLYDNGSTLNSWVVDELLESYVSWREECEAVRIAYRLWVDSGPVDCRLAYAAYLEALDQEEYAARAYADQIGLVRRLTAWTHQKRASPIPLTPDSPRPKYPQLTGEQ
jgi:hypothetical protein